MKHAFGMLSLYVQDVERAKTFYTEFLGMQFVQELSSQTFAYLQPVEGTSIALQDIASLPTGVPAQPGGFELNFEVEDVDQALQVWKTKGAEVLTDIMDMGAGRFFRAKDTEDHVLSVYQLYPFMKNQNQ